MLKSISPFPKYKSLLYWFRTEYLSFALYLLLVSKENRKLFSSYPQVLSFFGQKIVVKEPNLYPLVVLINTILGHFLAHLLSIVDIASPSFLESNNKLNFVGFLSNQLSIIFCSLNLTILLFFNKKLSFSIWIFFNL